MSGRVARVPEVLREARFERDPYVGSYILFLILLMLFFTYHLYLSRGFDNPNSALVPYVVIIPSIILLLIEIGLQIRAYIEPPEEGPFRMPTERLGQSVQPLGFILLLLVGFVIMGPFSTSILLIAAYVTANGSGSLQRRFALGTLVGIILNVIMILFFVYFVENHTFLEIGLLI